MHLSLSEKRLVVPKGSSAASACEQDKFAKIKNATFCQKTKLQLLQTPSAHKHTACTINIAVEHFSAFSNVSGRGRAAVGKMDRSWRGVCM